MQVVQIMDSVLLGRTGLRVSRLALGTAAFGLERYGICEPHESGTVSENAAADLIRAAVDHGINFFDTARGYGQSEAILGRALLGLSNCVVATKLSVPENGATLSASELCCQVMASLETSLRELRRDVLDIVQIHNATAKILLESEVIAVLETARQQGKLRFIGASVYGEQNALAAVQCQSIDTLQLALSLLDQRMSSKVIPLAREKKVGILIRSVFLKGVLTERVKSLPPAMHALVAASDHARQVLGDTWQSLPGTAVRFCLSVPGVHSVLVGLRSGAELPSAIAAATAGPLPDDMMGKTDALKLTDPAILDPSHWPTL